MATPHNSAENGKFAKTVLMPGDPLRAKFIAEHFLEDAELVTSVRNVLGYTGTYKGKRVSVMASGMGMPSIGIYSYELFKFYGVENIIRVGSTGACDPDLKLFDVILANDAYSTSTYAKNFAGIEDHIMTPAPELNARIEAAAEKLGKKIIKGRVGSSDNFYYATTPEDVHATQGVICLEMESFALFTNAKVLGKKAACLLTVSDSLITNEETTSDQREKAFTDMMEIALEAAE
ncbi:MAG: purine-nucleoside phosphorylase [Solobacterium sp.]|nr:purine-nucleoside phosphorylase [Solobacterium sp.]